MIQDNNLLLVGGAGRNVGKTEFVCRLIRKIASVHEVYALKVSAIFPDEHLFHGDHNGDEPSGSLFEETRIESTKDTSRMLRAGAKRVFYLRGEEAGIQAKFADFRRRIPKDAVVVCESNSLGQLVKPALSIMVKSVSGEIKPRAVTQMKHADLVVVSAGKSGFPELERIEIDHDSGWRLLD